MQHLAWITEVFGMTMLSLVKELYWLRVPERCCEGWSWRECLNGNGPAYLADSLQRVTDVQSRRRLCGCLRRHRWSSRWHVVQHWGTVLRTADQTTSCHRQPTHHSVLRWRRICFPGLSASHASHWFSLWLCPAVLSSVRLHHVNPVVWWWWWYRLSFSMAFVFAFCFDVWLIHLKPNHLHTYHVIQQSAASQPRGLRRQIMCGLRWLPLIRKK